MSHKDLWVGVLERIKPTIKKAHFLTWFQDTAIVEKADDKVVIGFPNAFAKDWVQSKYGVKLIQAIQEKAEEVKEVTFSVCGKLADKDNVEGVDLKRVAAIEEKKVRKVRNSNEVRVTVGDFSGHVSSQTLNSKYRLSNFVVGNDNRLPHAASLAVSHNPGGIYNPLYIYGSVGLGKTHLLQSIGNEVLSNFPDMVVKYMTAEKFVTEVVHAIGTRNTAKFKDQYRNVDCLLIDDVQFFARKDSSQQEFFHTFNELYDRNKQIVLTSDRAPSELDGLDDRLKSRFGMGMVVELLFPDFEARLAILNQKCQEFQVIIDPEVLQFIATNVHNSVREIEGVLRQVIAESQLRNVVPTIRSVAEIIKRLNKAQEIIGYDIDLKRQKAGALTAEYVRETVAEYYKLSVDQLVSNDRHKEISLPRQVCMFLIKQELGVSYERIGEVFGGRNHTTVMHACNKAADRLKKDLRLVKDVNAIKNEMGL